MAAKIIKFPPLTELQQQIDDYPARFKVLACGRRWGKSVFGRFKALNATINEGKSGWIVFPSYTNARSHWREISRMVGNLPSRRLEREMLLEFNRNGKISTLEIKSGQEPKNLRGSGLDYAVIDEAAFMSEAVWHEVVRPSLIDKQGWALIISSPNGMANYFYNLFMRGQDVLEPDWMSWQLPTSSNPYIPNSEIIAAQAEMTEIRYKQEILAEFLTDAGGVFRGVEQISNVTRLYEPNPNLSYIFGIDWARQNDFTVISIMEKETANQVNIERFSEVGYDVQMGRLARLIDVWQPVKIYAEANSMGGPLVEQLQGDYGNLVEGVYMTNEIKRELTERLAADIEHKRVGLLTTKEYAGQIQAAELGAYQLARTAGGMMYTYKARSGWNDDTVIALMLSNKGRRKVGKSVNYIKNPFYR